MNIATLTKRFLMQMKIDLYCNKMPPRLSQLEEKMPWLQSFEGQTDSQELILGGLRLKLMLTFYCSKNHRACKNHTKSTLPMLYKWNHKGWMAALAFKTCLLNILNPFLRPIAQKNRFRSQQYCLLTTHLVTQEL